ncbi:hypothetical protein ACYULU_05850 [Breznakiellaceae bacterium SP9]
MTLKTLFTPRKGACLVLVFLVNAALVYGRAKGDTEQSPLRSPSVPVNQAADMELFLGTREITWAQAAYFSLGAVLDTSPTTPQGAFAFAHEQGWLPENARSEESVTMEGAALLLMRSFAIPGGLMYSIFPNARYAYRELKSRGFIQGRVYASDSVSGAAFLQLLGELLSYAEQP